MLSLFLDRDGVINERIVDGYVTRPEDFRLLEGVLEAMVIFARRFDRIFMVTNQQGIGKGLMSVGDLELIHNSFLKELESAGARMDKIFFCPALKSEHSFMRKPSIGMALQARREFGVSLRHSIMVGDTATDMMFGRRAGMRTVLVGDEPEIAANNPHLVDYYYMDLHTYALNIDASIKSIS